MDYSVIIPVHNEEENIRPIYETVRKTMIKIGKSYEIVFIDDGSTDGTLKQLERLYKEARDLAIIALAKNTGKAEALQAGFDKALGEVYITLDGDGQEEPEDIPRLLDKLSEGYDVVFGWRHQRQDSSQKKFASHFAYIIRRVLTQTKIHDVGCPLRVFRKKDIQNIRLSKGLHRFFSLIMEKKGYKVTEIKVINYPRKSGVSKYGIWDRLIEGTRDLYRVMSMDIDKLMAGQQQYKISRIYRK